MTSARAGWAWGFVPFALLAAGVFVVPCTIFVQLAFEHGLADWRDLLDADAKLDALVRTLVVALQTTALCALLGYVYTAAIVRANRWARSLLLTLVVFPFLTSVLIRSYGWTVVLGNRGPVNELLRAVGSEGAATTLLYSRTGLLIGMVHVMLPLFVLPLYSVWGQLPSNLTRAARTLGANRLESFVGVELPLTVPGAAAGAILVFITSLGFFITPALLGGDGDALVSQFIDRDLATSADLGAAAVLGALLVAAVLLAIAAFRLAYPLEQLFVVAPTSRRGARRRGWRARPPSWLGALRLRCTLLLSPLPWGALCTVAAGAIGLYLVVPLAIVIPVSLTGEPYLHFPPDSLSLRWYQQVIEDPSWRFAAYNSLLTGLLATVMGLVSGLPIGLALARSRMSQRLKGGVMVVIALPAIVPLVVLALAVYAWFLDAHVVGSRLALAAAHALLGLPFLVVIVVAALRDVDVHLERTARSLGATPLRSWRLITLPLVKRAVVAGMLFAFLQSFDELLIARAVTDVDTYTLPVKMWNGANEEISPALGAVSVLSLLVTVLAFGLLVGVRRATRTVAP